MMIKTIPVRILRALTSLGFLGVLLIGGPASAAKVPEEDVLATIVKSTLATFDDANVTGIYTVLYEKSAKPLRDKFTPEKLADAFKVYHDNHVSIASVLNLDIHYTTPPTVDDNDTLLVKGSFDTTPKKVVFELKFIPSDGVWKPVGINVSVK